jgi:hypothetical protein
MLPYVIVLGITVSFVAILRLSVLAEEELKRQEKEAEIIAEYFEVKESKGSIIIGVMFLICAVVLLLAAIYFISIPPLYRAIPEGEIGYIIFALFLFMSWIVYVVGGCILGIYNICAAFRKHLVVEGEKFTYYPPLGKPKHYTIYDITKAYEGSIRGGQIISVYKNNKRIFSFNSDSKKYGLLKNKLQRLGHL